MRVFFDYTCWIVATIEAMLVVFGFPPERRRSFSEIGR